MFKDTREIEKQVSELVSKGEKMKLVLLLKNGYINERVFSPIEQRSKGTSDILFSHTQILYQPVKGYVIEDIHNIDYTKLRQLDKVMIPGLNANNGTINVLLKTLMLNGYQLY